MQSCMWPSRELKTDGGVLIHGTQVRCNTNGMLSMIRSEGTCPTCFQPLSTGQQHTPGAEELDCADHRLCEKWVSSEGSDQEQSYTVVRLVLGTVRCNCIKSQLSLISLQAHRIQFAPSCADKILLRQSIALSLFVVQLWCTLQQNSNFEAPTIHTCHIILQCSMLFPRQTRNVF